MMYALSHGIFRMLFQDVVWHHCCFLLFFTFIFTHSLISSGYQNYLVRLEKTLYKSQSSIVHLAKLLKGLILALQWN